MSKEIFNTLPDGLTVYFTLVDLSTGKYYYPVTPIFETYNASHWTSYALPTTKQVISAGGNANYYADMPAVAAGAYQIVMYYQVGGSAAATDTAEWSTVIQWDGAKEVAQTGDSFPGVSAVATAVAANLDIQVSTIPGLTANFNVSGAFPSYAWAANTKSGTTHAAAADLQTQVSALQTALTTGANKIITDGTGKVTTSNPYVAGATIQVTNVTQESTP